MAPGVPGPVAGAGQVHPAGIEPAGRTEQNLPGLEVVLETAAWSHPLQSIFLNLQERRGVVVMALVVMGM